MAMHKVTKRLKDGTVKVYEYEPRDYHPPAIEQCRAALEHGPLRLISQKNGGGGWRWKSAKRRARAFNDATVAKLIAEGYAVCVGKFVEKKGAVR